jgi:hypothetical protein
MPRLSGSLMTRRRTSDAASPRADIRYHCGGAWDADRQRRTVQRGPGDRHSTRVSRGVVPGPVPSGPLRRSVRQPRSMTTALRLFGRHRGRHRSVVPGRFHDQALVLVPQASCLGPELLRFVAVVGHAGEASFDCAPHLEHDLGFTLVGHGTSGCGAGPPQHTALVAAGGGNFPSAAAIVTRRSRARRGSRPARPRSGWVAPR